MIDLPANVVPPSSNKNRISPMGRHRGGHSYLRRAVAWIGALVGKVTFLPTSVHPVMGFEQLESSKHSDFQQQESGNCWGIESLDAMGWNTHA
jgi:hypothetical protein